MTTITEIIKIIVVIQITVTMIEEMKMMRYCIRQGVATAMHRATQFNTSGPINEMAPGVPHWVGGKGGGVNRE